MRLRYRITDVLRFEEKIKTIGKPLVPVFCELRKCIERAVFKREYEKNIIFDLTTLIGPVQIRSLSVFKR
ncbi:hypothetical protein LEP1GSC060_1632 [Leptospira weilii serovar Ranarum str. ICFT]|uniref:Uncharacterized protein n=1 Tax=Leptospira weilii serovar Ranarum str. ICFT TaxID=1218598 RepID=N1WBG8_9LEPT|nr:hypothetical protein LEP1GSC060_1632 [Leptospira weilii serovar Ranarum str. ICFT]